MSNSKSLVSQQQNPTPTAAELAVWQPGDIQEMWARTQAMAQRDAVPYARQSVYAADCEGQWFAIVSPFRWGTEYSETFGDQVVAQCAIRFLDLETAELDPEPTLANLKGNGLVHQLKKLTENEIRGGFWTIARVGKRGTFYLSRKVMVSEAQQPEYVESRQPALSVPMTETKRGPGRPRKSLTDEEMNAKQARLVHAANGASITDVRALFGGSSQD